MPVRVESFQLDTPGVMGIRLQGSFGRGDRQRLLSLVERCSKSKKTRLCLDCRNLDSLGESGAAALADLQRRLRELGGELVLVNAGEVICRFLQQEFTDLPLRCFKAVEEALAALTEHATVSDDVAGSVKSGGRPTEGQDVRIDVPSQQSESDLDQLLEKIESGDGRPDELVRRTADLVTASYITIADVLQAAESGSNPTVMGEALGMLLSSQDLAVETIYFHLQGDHYVATTGQFHLPTGGEIAAGLLRSRRPLTLLDLEDSDLCNEESRFLEYLQPDLILPLVRQDVLVGIAFLRRGGTEREYGISEMFALELLLLLLSQGNAAVVDGRPSAKEPVAHPESDPGPAAGRESLHDVKLELMRCLPEAQDIPHFWQVFISRMSDAAEVISLVCLNSTESPNAVYLAGKVRGGLQQGLLDGERIQAFFRTLECPVEIVNMPSSLELVRNMLLGCGLHWLAPIRAEGSQGLGVLALGLVWRCCLLDPGAELKNVMEITAEALTRLRERQNRADMNLGLLEDLLVNGRPACQADHVTREAVRTVRVLTRELGLTQDQERDLVLGTLLRNHGQEQAAIDDLAAGQLTGQDWELYRKHPDQGDRLLVELKAPETVRNAVRHHHERYDGRGFPLGLKGRDIPLAARLVAVAQCQALHLMHDASQESAMASFKQEAGHSLDPDLVEILLKAIRREGTIPIQV